jgi:hypothetical protein
MRGNGTRRVFDEGQVRVTLLCQRRRDADRHHVARRKFREVRCRPEQSFCHDGMKDLVRDRAYVRPADLQFLDLGVVDVKADNLEASPRGRRRQGQTDIAKPHDANRGRPRFQF